MGKIKRLYSLIGKNQLTYDYDRLRFVSGKPTNKRITNYILSRLEYLARVKRPFTYPIGLQLEPTTDCQLSCPFCPRQRDIRVDGPGYMDMADYEKLLQEIGDYLITIAFWQWGEPLLHPGINAMIKLANQYGIITFISTNGQIDPGEIDLKGLVDSGLNMIIVSMDGAEQEFYEKFRQKGKMDKVKRFVKAIVKEKKGSPTSQLLINVRTIAISENEKGIQGVHDFAQQAGADIFSVKGVSLYYDANPNNPVLPDDYQLRTFQYQGIKNAVAYERMPNLCSKPWSYPTLRQDGTLLMCECDHKMSNPLGNVFIEGSFKKVWQHRQAQDIRTRFKPNGIIDLAFCKRCRYKIDDAMRHVINLQNTPDIDNMMLKP